MRFLFLCAFLMTGFPISLRAAEEGRGNFWNSLNQAQHALLKAGKPVVIEEELPENPWPRFTIYQLVKATPAQVTATFWDCEKDPEYIPNCTKVTVLSHPSPGVVEAEYTLKMPFFLPDEVYVSRNELQHGADGSYGVDWRVVTSRYTKACAGSLRVEEHDGYALLRYSNLVEPGSRIAKIMKASASRQVVESVQALVDRVGDLMIRPGGSLDREVRSMEAALGQ